MPSQDELAKKLLDDPQVQQAMAAAGENAMKDPKVQEAIKQAAMNSGSALAQQIQDQGPEMLKKVQSQALTMANDPEVQAKAKEYAGKAGEMAKQYGAMGANMFMNQVEQGPTGVRFLACMISMLSMANSVMTVINPLSLTAPITYVISMYQLMFAASTALFELPPEHMEKVSFLKEYQDLLAKKCNFLTDVLGRGLFYIFQGSLWAGFASLADLLDLAVTVLMIFIGALHVGMHYGVGPSAVAAQMRGYTGLEQQPQP
jgi:hypothetical protein